MQRDPFGRWHRAATGVERVRLLPGLGIDRLTVVVAVEQQRPRRARARSARRTRADCPSSRAAPAANPRRASIARRCSALRRMFGRSAATFGIASSSTSSPTIGSLVSPPTHAAPLQTADAGRRLIQDRARAHGTIANAVSWHRSGLVSRCRASQGRSGGPSAAGIASRSDPGRCARPRRLLIARSAGM